ncbi:Cytochrome P450 monooxygenase COX2 [Psilocybe cubensis]|uniref:Cytochrome P450 n=2 Tax=Psilocybe cubensis TaxID=181762 RepID=A0A8H7Y424_PSICU|nr:Cytochrome P450 monooxygenase COX2 [Psilocybe cubensis]KAH9483711.1 Cytochrome P450 monooxygenase COX2 [Psilocybe cubensis]
MFVLRRVGDFIVEHPFYGFIAGTVSYVAFLRVRASTRRNPRRLPLPPGPKGLPILGSIFDMPLEYPWLVYDQWFKIYGDMVYFEVLGQPFLLLGSLKRTSDLFDRRSWNYSSRAHMPMLVELMNWSFSLALMPYGQTWRRHRRAFNEHFHRNTVWKYKALQQRESRALLRNLLDSPNQFLHHIRHTFAAMIMDIAYGARVEDSSTDPHVLKIEEALEGLTEAGVPGAFLVDIMPILKYVPSWFPGAGFKRKAAKWSKINTDVVQDPFIRVEENMKEGKATPSMATSLIDRLPEETDPGYADERAIAQNVAAVAYIGKLNTVSATQSFFMAMALYPEVQRKAQEELDRVIGRDRLPEFSDQLSLPYVMAVVKETMRWQLVTPLGLGHSSSQDDEYDGYFIPQGTIVIGNSWSILHDPIVFSDPLEFIPERYLLKNGQLDPNALDPKCAAFGFGRRICPGRHLSDNALYIVVSSVLAAFDIKPILGSDGNPVDLKAGVTNGMVSFPIPFRCEVKPRGEKAAALISDSGEY